MQTCVGMNINELHADKSFSFLQFGYLHRVHQGDAHNHVSSRIGGIDDGFQVSNSFATRKSMRVKVSLEGFQSWRVKSLPLFLANSRGGKYSRLLCGRSSLYSSFHAAIFIRALNKFPAGVRALIAQLPVETLHKRVLRWPSGLDVHQFDLLLRRPRQKMSRCELRSVVQGIASSVPRSATTLSNSRVTLRFAKFVSTSNTRHSRVYTSITLSTRNFLPLSTASCTKSNAHSSFGPLTAGREAAARNNPRPLEKKSAIPRFASCSQWPMPEA